MTKLFSVVVLTVLVVAVQHSLAATSRGTAPVPVRDATGQQVGLYEGSYAYVVGVSDYSGAWSRLPGVKDDVDAIKAALEAHGFLVETLIDPDQQALEEGYREFITRYGLDKGNRLLFYFAGHGYTHKPAYATDDHSQWMGYIVTREAPSPIADFAGFRRHAMSMQRFEELAKTIESKHALFVFDSCFSGSVFQLMRGIPASISRKTGLPVRQFISSGTADQEVPDVSEFRRQFVELLGGEGDVTGDGYITGEELGLLLAQRVNDATQGSQTPQHGKMRDPNGVLNQGDFVFSLAPPRALSAQLNYVYRSAGRGPSKPLEEGSVLRSGDTYKIIFSPTEDGFVYIFQEDAKGQLFRLFPMRAFGGVVVNNANPVQAGRTYTLPAPDKSFLLDDTRGQERLYFLVSRTRDPQLEETATVPTLEQTRLGDYLRSRGLSGIVPDATNEPLKGAWNDGEAMSSVIKRRLDDFCDGCVLVTEFEHQ